MASNVYTRYVPPKKPKPPPSSTTAETAPPPTNLAASASASYSRYIPSPKPKSHEVKDNVSPKRKREVEPELERPKKSKKIKKDKPVQSPTQDDTLAEEDSKHRKVMERREKSLKKAQKLAKKEAKKAAKEAENETEKEVVPEEPVELHDLVPLPQPEPVPQLPIKSSAASLPAWLASPIRVAPSVSADFSDLGIQKEAVKVLQSKGFDQAFAVQAAVLPLLLPGKSQNDGDILVSAATGSGKTLAYVLPMIEDISQNCVTRLRGLIIMPTRELVTQAREICEVCATAFSSGKRKRVKIGTAVGNESFAVEQTSIMEQEDRYDPEARKEQERRLNRKWESSDWESDSDDDDILCDDEPISRLPDHVLDHVSKVDVLICTPGRLVEHLKSTPGFTLQYAQWLVVDEADKLLDQAYQDWLNIVIDHMAVKAKPSIQAAITRHRVRKVILSATMTRDVGQLAELKLHRPKLVVLEGETMSHDVPNIENGHILPTHLTESGIKVDEEFLKPLYLIELMSRENMTSQSLAPGDTLSDSGSPSPSVTPHGVLIFTKSNESALRLSRLIALLQPTISTLLGTLTSTTQTSTRKSTINTFNAGKLSILIASDLVSRGLDLPNLAHVISYDMPTSVTNYVHRVGRTARAGKKGFAWTLFTPTEGRWFWNEIGRSDAIQRMEGTKIQRVNFKAELFNEDARVRYESALEELGREAGRSGKGKGKKKE